MSREWKPGDVARLKYDDREMVAVRVEDDDEGHWHTDSDTTASGMLAEWVRPLVVIDPEDREQVERLNAAQDAEYARRGVVIDDFDHIDADVMQAALREFANPKPPRPEEPTGLGAVVEDEKGIRWVRDVEGTETDPDSGEWYSRGVPKARRYADIEAVRVLSEGVAS